MRRMATMMRRSSCARVAFASPRRRPSANFLQFNLLGACRWSAQAFVSREMIQESPILAAIKKGVTNRLLSELEKLAETDAATYGKVWDNFGAVLKEGLYEDFERRAQLLELARFPRQVPTMRLAPSSRS